jgi:predicted nucleic acid-binding protein
LIYRFDDRDPRKQKIATDLTWEGLRFRKAVISYQVIQEFYNTMYRRFPSVFTAEDSEEYFAKVLRRFSVVNSSAELFGQALRLHHKHKLSWYDSLIVAAALEAKCDVLYTEDLQHGQRFGDIMVTNPFL